MNELHESGRTEGWLELRDQIQRLPRQAGSAQLVARERGEVDETDGVSLSRHGVRRVAACRTRSEDLHVIHISLRGGADGVWSLAPRRSRRG